MTITLPPPFVPGSSTLGLAALSCDICKRRGKKRRATFDALVPRHRQWAFLCTWHFIYFDCNLGVGKGQALIDSAHFPEGSLEAIRLANKEA